MKKAEEGGGSPFVRRLIPTVAAATLTLSACGPGESGNNKGGTNNGGTNNQSMNAGTNNGTPGNVTPNNLVANNTSTNNTTTNNTTTNNTSTNNTATNNTSTNNAATNNGTTQYVETDGDGSVSDDELRAFCQAWADCDAAYFQQSFDTVDECFSVQRADLDETLTQYEDEYGPECAAVEEKLYECYLAAWGCTAGMFGYEDIEHAACYTTYEAEFEAMCQ